MHFFFFNDTATTEIYTLSLHDALPISFVCYLAGVPIRLGQSREFGGSVLSQWVKPLPDGAHQVDRNLHLLESAGDRKSTRLNSSHANISYAVFCLKKKK